MPENRRQILDYDESWVIISDALLGRLMRCMFQGRHYLQLIAEDIRCEGQIRDALRYNEWAFNPFAQALTMSEMVVMFGYIYRQLKPCSLAREMGVHTKTVNTFLYTGLAKNGLQGVNVKHLINVE